MIEGSWSKLARDLGPNLEFFVDQDPSLIQKFPSATFRHPRRKVPYRERTLPVTVTFY